MEEVTSSLSGIASQAAQRHGLPFQLVIAILQYESTGDVWAWNPEPRYRWLWNVKTNQPFRELTPAEASSESPPKDFPCLRGDRDQEWWGQQASWGAMQLMGAVGRELGFRGPYLTQLCDHVLNIPLGCLHLRKLALRFLPTHGWAGVCAAYNGGPGALLGPGQFRNPQYPAKIKLILGEWPEAVLTKAVTA